MGIPKVHKKRRDLKRLQIETQQVTLYLTKKGAELFLALAEREGLKRSLLLEKLVERALEESRKVNQSAGPPFHAAG